MVERAGLGVAVLPAAFVGFQAGMGGGGDGRAMEALHCHAVVWACQSTKLVHHASLPREPKQRS